MKIFIYIYTLLLSLYGKKFSYISVIGGATIPIYISEATLFLSSIWMLVLIFLKNIKYPSALVFLIFTWLLWGAIEVIRGYDTGIWALRDYALIYYTVFTLIVIAIYQSSFDTNKFSRILLLYAVLVSGFNLLARLGFDSEYLQAVNAVPVMIALFVFTYYKSENQFYNLLIKLMFIITVLLTLTGYVNRSMLLGYLIAITLNFIVEKDSKKIKARAILFGSLVLFVIILLISYGKIDLNHSNTIGWRLLVWREVFINSLDSFIIGHGLGYRAVTEYMIPDNATALHPHNVLLTILYQQGLVGVLIFLVLISRVYIDSVRYYMRSISENIKLKTNFKIIFSSFIGQLLFSFMNVSLEGPYQGIIFWITIGFLYVLIKNKREVL